MTSRVSLLRRLAGLGWGTSAKTLCTAALSLVYSTAEYCAPVWCRSAHTRLIDSVLNDALRIVSGCLLPTPTEYLPVLSGIQPAELRRQGATLSLANRSSLDPDHILHGHLQRSTDAGGKRLKSRHPFASAARKLLDYLSQMGTIVAQWTNTKWNMEYSERTSGLHAFISRVSTRPLGMSLRGLPGPDSIVCVLALDVLARPCTNGVSLLSRTVSVVPMNRPQITLSHCVPHIGHLEECLV